MWRKKFYAVLWDGNGADLRPYLVEHLEYMIGLERAGKLFASGRSISAQAVTDLPFCAQQVRTRRERSPCATRSW